MKKFITLLLIVLLAACANMKTEVIDIPLFQTVSLAGSFNNWNAKDQVTIMKYLGNNKWSLNKLFEKGQSKFKFVMNGGWDIHRGVSPDGRLIQPGSDITLNISSFGFYEILLDLNIDTWSVKPAPASNAVAFAEFKKEYDLGEEVLLSAEKSFARSGKNIRKFFWTQDSLDAVKLKELPFESGESTLSLKPEQPGLYHITLSVDDGEKGLDYKISFRVFESVNDFVFGDTEDSEWNFQNRRTYTTPDWAKNVVWYQIMLDRWRNLDSSNDPDSSLPWRWNWFAPFTDGESKSFYGGDGVWNRNFGGDLAGLIRSLNYLEELGVTGIYLNPIFEAPGHHKYNTADYRHIDDNFGTRGDIIGRWKTETEDSRTWAFTQTDSLFLTFLNIAHQRGFKVIIDGVFNHSGTEFWAFKDLIENGQNSRYKNWYNVKEWNVKPSKPGAPSFAYEGWAGFDGLPEYKEDENGLAHGIREHIFDITRRWMDPNGDGDPSDGVDGWRLDVPENVNERFWREWRKVVKGINPNAYITGEIWGDARDWLDGDHFDAVMNYEFLKRVHAFFLPGGNTQAMKAPEFARSICELLKAYSWQSDLVLQNLLSSHDIDRISSAIHNRAGWKRGRVQDENPLYDTGAPSDYDYEILAELAAFQFSWPGAPMIYYGDEVGMFGADDPTNRMSMWWDDLMPYSNSDYFVRRGLKERYARLIAIRNSFSALRTGRVRFLLADDTAGIIAFERRDSENSLMTIINNSDSFVISKIPMEKESEFIDLLQPRNARTKWGKVKGIDAERNLIELLPSAIRLKSSEDGLEISLPPHGSAILLEL